MIANIYTVENIANVLQKKLIKPEVKSWFRANSFTKEGKIIEQLPVIFPAFIALECSNRFSLTKQLTIFRKEMAKKLLRQKSNESSFNWFRRDVESVYPDDIDDTSCAWAAIMSVNPLLMKKDDVENLLNHLFTLEVEPGGPYRTWITDMQKKIWKDIDPIVNVNIAYFLAKKNIFLYKQIKFISNAFVRNNILSPYYPDFSSNAYFFSRMYYEVVKRDSKATKILDEAKGRVSDEIVKRFQGAGWKNSHEAALFTTALINLGSDLKIIIDSGIEYLCSAYPKWGYGSFCLNTKKNEVVTFVGSEELTSILGLETLSLWLDHKKKEELHIFQENIQKLFFTRLALVRARIPTALKKSSENIMKELMCGRRFNEIVLFPTFFLQTQSLKDQKKISNDVLVRLGLANFFGWCAYTIFDNIIDRDDNFIIPLPVGLQFERMAEEIYLNLFPQDSEFRMFFKEIMSNTDVSQTRLSSIRKTIRIQDLADQSMGHFLGAFALLYLLKPSPDRNFMEGLHKFFSSLLIVRQISDDVHDWEEDFHMKRKTIVTHSMIRKKLTFRQSTRIFSREILPLLEYKLAQHIKIMETALFKIPLKDKHFLRYHFEKIKRQAFYS